MAYLAASLAFSFTAKGQDLEPRTYANTPVGLNFLIAGYGYTSGGVATDPALPIENTQIELYSGVLAYARAIDIYGKSANHSGGALCFAAGHRHCGWPGTGQGGLWFNRSPVSFFAQFFSGRHLLYRRANPSGWPKK